MALERALKTRDIVLFNVDLEAVVGLDAIVRGIQADGRWSGGHDGCGDHSCRANRHYF